MALPEDWEVDQLCTKALVEGDLASVETLLMLNRFALAPRSTKEVEIQEKIKRFILSTLRLRARDPATDPFNDITIKYYQPDGKVVDFTAAVLLTRAHPDFYVWELRIYKPLFDIHQFRALSSEKEDVKRFRCNNCGAFLTVPAEFDEQRHLVRAILSVPKDINTSPSGCAGGRWGRTFYEPDYAKLRPKL